MRILLLAVDQTDLDQVIEDYRKVFAMAVVERVDAFSCIMACLSAQYTPHFTVRTE